MNPFNRRPANLAAAPDWAEVFGRHAPLEVDVGFGKGLFLVDRARESPGVDVVGIEHRHSFVEKTRARIAALRLRNAYAMEGEAFARITTCFPSASVSRFYVFFPDPWWKRRHHKRRLWTPEMAALLADRLVPGGELFAQTDVQEYATFIVDLLDATRGLVNTAGPGSLTRWENEIPPSPRERRYRIDGTPYYQARYRKRVD
jgi:tRNA (guanine-N7-)-methyltransferase